VRLRDMLDNIDAVSDMAGGVDFAAYQRDFKLRRAVERCVEIISEASRSLPADLKAMFPDQSRTRDGKGLPKGITNRRSRLKFPYLRFVIIDNYCRTCGGLQSCKPFRDLG